MNFSDQDLKARFEKVISMTLHSPEDLRPVIALMNMYDFYSHMEGMDSPKVQEVVELLLCEELRPGLRHWYRDAGEGMNPAAMEFRERLGQRAGERFG